MSAAVIHDHELDVHHASGCLPLLFELFRGDDRSDSGWRLQTPVNDGLVLFSRMDSASMHHQDHPQLPFLWSLNSGRHSRYASAINRPALN